MQGLVDGRISSDQPPQEARVEMDSQLNDGLLAWHQGLAL